jgi:hypothetical protein
MENSPKSLAPKDIPEDLTLKFLDIHPAEIARQLTLLGQSCWIKLTSRELTELVQAKCVIKAYRSPWIDKMYKRREEVINLIFNSIQFIDIL